MAMKEMTNRVLRSVPTWAVYVVGALWVIWMFYLAATGGLGIEPIEALEHTLGEKALQLLILGLAVSPFRRFTGLNLMKFRRAIGVLAFSLVLLHLLVWLFLDVQIPSQIWLIWSSDHT